MQDLGAAKAALDKVAGGTHKQGKWKGALAVDASIEEMKAAGCFKLLEVAYCDAIRTRVAATKKARCGLTSDGSTLSYGH